MTQCPVGFEGIDMNDPKQALAWALGSMPSHQQGGLPVAIPPKAVPAWSEFLTDLGIEFNPAKQKKFPIASEQPGMGWLSPIRWVSREEYDKHEAQKRSAAGEVNLDTVLSVVNPDLAQALADMTDVEKRDAMAAQAAKFNQVFARMQALRAGGETEG